MPRKQLLTIYVDEMVKFARKMRWNTFIAYDPANRKEVRKLAKQAYGKLIEAGVNQLYSKRIVIALAGIIGFLQKRRRLAETLLGGELSLILGGVIKERRQLITQSALWVCHNQEIESILYFLIERYFPEYQNQSAL
jgi:hypothetical protein